ncbi:MAG TPA: transposase [Solirubrobacteraceae bacterium]|nr:transposase [Solirubrobacteraceae bacterium]
MLADTGYWHSEQTDEIVAAGTQVLIPPQSRIRATPRPGWDTGCYAFMRAVLDSPAGSTLYHQRAQSVDPTFGQIKHNPGFRQFRRRGRAAARSEWRLITATTTCSSSTSTGSQPPARDSRPGVRALTITSASRRATRQTSARQPPTHTIVSSLA